MNEERGGSIVIIDPASDVPLFVQIAEQIAEIPVLSGIGLRFIVTSIVTVVTIIYVLRYCRKHQSAYRSQRHEHPRGRGHYLQEKGDGNVRAGRRARQGAREAQNRL